MDILLHFGISGGKLSDMNKPTIVEVTRAATGPAIDSDTFEEPNAFVAIASK